MTDKTFTEWRDRFVNETGFLPTEKEVWEAAVAAEREQWRGLVREFVDFLEPMRFDRPTDDAKATELDKRARALLEGLDASH